jgi:hypothetical protein
MSPPVGHALGVDFGTSHTVAVIRWPDGRARPLLVDGSPLLPSAVYAEPDGGLAVGRDAIHSARLDPARFEPNPKRRIDDGAVLLGEREVPVGDLITAVLSRVAEEWRRTVGDATPTVTLTCPATWGATRRTLLSEAAARAGLPGARLVAEPVAATTYFAEVLGRDVPLGSVVVVHDFGAGTFDASVVARKASGFEVLAVDGRDDVGGVDVDAALVEHLGKAYRSRDPDAWDRLVSPATVEDRRAKRQLWDDVRVAKERLSRAQRADLVLPLLEIEVHLTREELEELARPLLEQTVKVTDGLMRWARLAEGNVAGVFLVGGSSRIPLMATLLHRTLGEAPVVIEQPELVVAEGSILAEAALLASTPAASGPTGAIPLPSAGAPRPAVAPTVPISPAAPVRPVSSAPASPVSPAPVSPAAAGGPPRPVSPAGPARPMSPAGPARPVSPAAGTTPPGSPATPTSPVSGSPVSGPPAPGSPAPGPSVGRVIVPGAQPPGRPRSAAAPPVTATRQMPAMDRPSSTIPMPPRERRAGQPGEPQGQSRGQSPGQSPGQPQGQSPGQSPGQARQRRQVPPARPMAPAPRAAARPAPAPTSTRDPYRSTGRSGAGRLRAVVRGLFITGLLIAVPAASALIAFRIARSR